MTAIIVLFILIVVAVLLISIYNRLVQLRVRCDSAWSDIDVQLKRRHDLIPELTEIVNGFSAQQKSALENVVELRARAIQTSDPEDRAAVERQLSAALTTVLAVVESHPELKSSANFKPLRTSLDQNENSIQMAQRYYNSVVTDLNAKMKSFPASLLAGMFGFASRPLFAASEEREPVRVKF